jgi:hypothetical protein
MTSVGGNTKRLRSVPVWVRPPLEAVAAAEDYLLWLYDRTRSSEVLGSWTSLSWLGAFEGARTPGPLGRPGLPTELQAWQDATVASAIADGRRYPPSAWWAEQFIELDARMPPDQWALRIASPYERHYAHGVTVALCWLLGRVDDPSLMAPIRFGDGRLVPEADRERYRTELRVLLVPPACAPAEPLPG